MPYHNPSQNLSAGFQPGVSRINAAVGKAMVPNNNGSSSNAPHSNNMNNRPTVNGLPSAQPVKRQNSKTKLTPQQLSLAMANNFTAQAANSLSAPVSSQNQAAALTSTDQQQQTAAGIPTINGTPVNMHKRLTANSTLQQRATATAAVVAAAANGGQISSLQTPQRAKPGIVNGSPNMMMTPVMTANGMNSIGIQTPNNTVNQATAGLPLKMPPPRLAMMAGTPSQTPGSPSPNTLTLAHSLMQVQQAANQQLTHGGIRSAMAVPVVNGLPVSLSQNSAVSSPSLLATPLPLSPQLGHTLPQQGQQQQLSAAMIRAPSKSPQQGMNNSSPPHHQARISHVSDTRCWSRCVRIVWIAQRLYDGWCGFDNFFPTYFPRMTINTFSIVIEFIVLLCIPTFLRIWPRAIPCKNFSVIDCVVFCLGFLQIFWCHILRIVLFCIDCIFCFWLCINCVSTLL